MWTRTCAQRLAASPEKSRFNAVRLAYQVLVLNASRHHRKNRAQTPKFKTPEQLCSTPRGITGKIARDL